MMGRLAHTVKTDFYGFNRNCHVVRIGVNNAMRIDRHRHMTRPEKQITSLNGCVFGQQIADLVPLHVAIAGAGNSRA